MTVTQSPPADNPETLGGGEGSSTVQALGKWWWLPPVRWLGSYQRAWLASDLVAGVTLAAYAIPVSLAYAALAGLPPQIGIYGYLLGGLGYALLGSSRQLAIGPTSAISLMIAATVGAMAEGDAQRYVQIASLAAFTVALLCLLAWLFRLSVLVTLVSDSILTGFKVGAGLTIAMTQLPKLFGVDGGGHNFFERLFLLLGQLGNTQLVVLAVGLIAIALLLLGERLLPGRPVALGVVALAIVLATVLGLPALGVPVTGPIPEGLPTLSGPSLRLRDVEGILPLAGGCLLLAYIEGVSAARTFAAKHGYELDARQEFLGLGAANLLTAFGQGYPVAGGLSQSAVNDKAGARTPLAVVFASITLALCLLFLTGLLENLPKAVLAAVVLTAILGLFDFRGLLRMWHVSRIDFFRPEASLLYVNAGSVFETLMAKVQTHGPGIRTVVCDLSASPHLDLAGARMLNSLNDQLAARGVSFQIVGARGRVRDLLRADGLAAKIGGLERTLSLDDVIGRHS